MTHVPTELEDLRSLYRSAFDEWASHVRRLGDIRESSPEHGVLQDAQDLTTSAEERYRDVRNRLADVMVPPEPDGSEDLGKTTIHLAQMDDRSLHEFLGMCDQFCNAAARRGEEPPQFFSLRKKLAAEELRRRSLVSSS